MSVRLRLRDGVLAQTALEHAVLLDTLSGEYFELNPVGSHIVRRLLAGDDRQAAIDSVAQRFDIDHAQAQADAGHFIDDLLRRGLLLAEPHA